MSDYRTVAAIVNKEIVLYQFDGCRYGKLWSMTEDYCTEKCGIWVLDQIKVELIIDRHYSSRKEDKEATEAFNRYEDWKNSLMAHKVLS